MKTFEIGKIVAHHAVRGELKIYPYTDNLNLLKELGYILVDGVKYIITSSRIHKNMIIIKLEGLNTIESTMFLINKNIHVYRDDVEDDGEGYYLVDIIGLPVYENGALLGVLDYVIQNSHQDIFEIKRNDGSKFLLPSVPEFVKNIDLIAKRIDVKIPNGLFEI